MGSRGVAGGSRPAGGRAKKLSEDIRRAFEQADVSKEIEYKLKTCAIEQGEEPKACLWKANHPENPCIGCPVREYAAWQPELFTTAYASFLNQYMEAFKISPTELSWFDFEIYQVFQKAKADFERAQIKDGGEQKNPRA